MNAQKLIQMSNMDTLRTGNSWGSNEISSTQDSNINNAAVIETASSTIEELQSMQDSATIGEEDDPLGRIDARSKSMYFSDRLSSEYCFESLPSLKCADEDASIGEELAPVPVDASSSIISLPSLETGISVTDMTAEVPSEMRAVSVIEPDGQLEVNSPIMENKIGLVYDKKLMLQDETATNTTCKTYLKTEYSITKLGSSDNILSILYSDTDLSVGFDPTSACVLMGKHLSNNCYNSDSEFTTITETKQKKKLDEMSTAEVVLTRSLAVVTVK